MSLIAWSTKTAGVFYSPSYSEQAGEQVCIVALIMFIVSLLYNILKALGDE